MTNKQIITKVKNVIAQGNIEIALNILARSQEILVNKDSRDIIIQLNSRYKSLSTKSIKGIISDAEEKTEFNNIANSTLNFLSNLEDVIDFHENNIEVSASQSQKTKHVKISKYAEKKGIWSKIKMFFTKVERTDFSLYSVKLKQYYIISSPNNISVEKLSNYIARNFFPNLKEQHFIWKLEQNNTPIPRIAKVKNSPINSNDTVYLTAEYKYHDEIWGNNSKKKVFMEDKKLQGNDFGDFNQII